MSSDTVSLYYYEPSLLSRTNKNLEAFKFAADLMVLDILLVSRLRGPKYRLIKRQKADVMQEQGQMVNTDADKPGNRYMT